MTGGPKSDAVLVNCAPRRGWSLPVSDVRVVSGGPSLSISGSERTDSGTFRCAFTGLRIADRLAGTLTITRGTERICCVVFTGTVSSSTAPLPPIHEVPWIREQVRELQDRITGILQGGVLSVCREFRGAE